MKQQPKGGEVIFVKPENGFFIRVHTRSQNYRPVPHIGNTDKFLRLTQERLDDTEIINPDNTPFVDSSNPFDQIKAAVSKYKGLRVQFESVDVPHVSMDRSVACMLIAINVTPPRVVAASSDPELKVLFDKAAETMNQLNRIGNKTNDKNEDSKLTDNVTLSAQAPATAVLRM